MKRKIAALLLLIMVPALLAGCGKAPETTAAADIPTAAPETAAVQESAPVDAIPASQETAETVPGHDWAEPNAVDDSGSIPSDGNYQHFLQTYVDRWVESGEILDSAFVGMDGSSFGWVCFSGTPKVELGWKTTEYQGRECYCRGLFARCLDEDREGGDYVFGKSIAMEPVKQLESLLLTETGEMILLPKELPVLKSAELYVPQLGRSFVLTDPEALRGLEWAFSEPELESFVQQEKPSMSGMEGMKGQNGFLPLYLHYADGSSSLALAAGDGSDFCMVWNEGFSSFGPVSLFERFGVPLPSPGYTHHADGSTTIEEVVEGMDSSLQLAFRHEVRNTFDAHGRLVRYEHTYHREDNIFDTSEVRDYYYLLDGKPDHVDIHWEDAQSGSHDQRESFTYNERGKVTRFASNDLNDESRGMYYDYLYDDQDRLTAIIYHYRDGREGLPSGNSYFWYDDAGLRHTYGVDQEGNLIGGPEESDGDRPMRRG